MNGQAGYETGSQMAGFGDSCNKSNRKDQKPSWKPSQQKTEMRMDHTE